MDKKFWNGKKVLITGHTGFKGSWLSLWLHSLGANVSGFAMDPITNPNIYDLLELENLINDFRGDIRDLRSVEKSIDSAKPDIIIHLAAQALVRTSYNNPRYTFETNIMGTVNLLDIARSCKSVKAILIITSDKCYENRGKDYSYRETDPMGGHDPYSSSKGCAELIASSYRRSFFKDLGVAEMTKIMENIQRAVNIGLVNELKMVADKMDIDLYEVINAAATKPFGFTPYYPGPGLGGHCIPIDPYYLTWKAKQIGIETRFIKLAGEINTDMPKYVVQKLGEALKTVNKSIKNSKILVLGLSYKKNIDDTRESPSLVIMDMLLQMGANVQYSDPFFPVVPKTRKFSFDLERIELTPENIKSFDLVLLSTDHDDFDYNLIEEKSRLIMDTRNRYQNSNKLFKA